MEQTSYQPPSTGWPSPFVIHTHTIFSVLEGIVAAGGVGNNVVWPNANRAYYIPFVLNEPRNFFGMIWANGGTQSGNVDVGIYNVSLAQLFHSGSVAQGAINTVQKVTIPGGLFLAPGRYYIAHAMDNAIGAIVSGGVGIQNESVSGLGQQDTAFPLPATATPVTLVATMIPITGIYEPSWL